MHWDGFLVVFILKEIEDQERSFSTAERCHTLKFDDADMANILQDQFSSVFTVEDDSQIPSIPEKTDQKVSNLLITEVMILEEILALNPNESCGPDDLCLSILLISSQAQLSCS